MNRLSEVKWIESVRVESNPVPASAELERDPPVSLSRVTLIGQLLRSVPSWSACRQRVDVEEVVVVILCTTTSPTAPISSFRHSFHVDQREYHVIIIDPVL